MSEHLTAEQERELKKGINERLTLLRKRGSNRRLGHITEAENDLYKVDRSDAERAISKLHSNHGSGRAIAKATQSGSNATAAIAAIHGDRSLAGRDISGNATLVAKLAGAVAVALTKDFSSAAEAKRAIRKLIDAPAPDVKAIQKRIETGSSNDFPRNQTAKLVSTDPQHFLDVADCAKDYGYKVAGVARDPDGSARSVHLYNEDKDDSTVVNLDKSFWSSKGVSGGKSGVMAHLKSK